MTNRIGTRPAPHLLVKLPCLNNGTDTVLPRLQDKQAIVRLLQVLVYIKLNSIQHQRDYIAAFVLYPEILFTECRKGEVCKGFVLCAIFLFLLRD